MNELIKEFCATKPEADVIIGYGSGVKKQAHDKGLPKQIDVIMGVRNPLEWHRKNHILNPKDYASELGFKLLPLYHNLGTKVNYLAFLPYQYDMFKIGVISLDDLKNDLLYWDNFYIAGRLQKPVEIIKDKEKLFIPFFINRLNALRTALLISKKEQISESELYENLCSLSFIGDWRRTFNVETSNKIHNIVEGSFEELHKIYGELISNYCEKQSDNFIIDYEKLLKDLRTLPKDLRNKILDKSVNPSQIGPRELEKFKSIILHYFRSKNIVTSALQPAKGLILNGSSKTKMYLNQKLSKR